MQKYTLDKEGNKHPTYYSLTDFLRSFSVGKLCVGLTHGFIRLLDVTAVEFVESKRKPLTYWEERYEQKQNTWFDIINK